MENLEKSHAACTGTRASNTQHIPSKRDVLAQVADVKFRTLHKIPMSFSWISEIGKVEIFEKSHTTHTNVQTNDFQYFSLTENAQVQVAYEKIHTLYEISMSFSQIGENVALRNFFNIESCSTMPANMCINHPDSRHSKRDDISSLLEVKIRILVKIFNLEIFYKWTLAVQDQHTTLATN
jgi:hypothetical protein